MTGASVVTGVSGEENLALSKEQSSYVQARSLRLLRSLLRPLRGRLLATVTLVLTGQALRVAGPAIIAHGIDVGLPQALAGDRSAAVTAGLTYVAAAVVAGLCSAGYIRVSAFVSQRALLDLRSRVYAHTQALSVSFHERYTSGRVIARQTSDLEAMSDLLDNGLTSFVSTLINMCFTAIALFLLDWRAGLVLLVAALPMALLARWFEARARAAQRRSRVASAKMIGHFVETMAGIRAVQVYRREDAEFARHQELAGDYRDATGASLHVNSVMEPSSMLIGNLTLSIALAVGAFRVLDGGLAVGVLVATLLYTRRFFQPVPRLAMIYNSFQSAAAALEKISGLLEERPEVRDPESPRALPAADGRPQGHLEFRHVAFRYATGPQVLPAFDLDIPAGTRVALVGATGAGKSTIAKLVARFYDPTAGEILLDGVDLRDLDDATLRGAVVMVTQEAYLFSGSIRDNIALAKPDATDAEVERAARAIGAHEFIAALPDGYATDVNKRGARVSAGQRQLISFARAFLADPAVLVLDEATSSLDIPGERLVQDALDTLLAGRTSLTIAHRLSTVQNADRILVISGGRVIEDGSPAQLIAGHGQYAALFEAWEQTLA